MKGSIKDHFSTRELVKELLMKYNFNRVDRIMRYLKHMEKEITLKSKKDNDLIALYKKRNKRIQLKAHALGKIRAVFIILFLLSAFSAFGPIRPLAENLFRTLFHASLVFGTTVCVILIFGITNIINAYTVDLQMNATHMIAIYEKHNKGKMSDRFQHMVDKLM